MNEMFTPDPENLNQEEEAELTYRLQEAMHEFNPGENGKCVEEVRKFCYEHKVIDYHNTCGSPSYSVLHYDNLPVNHCGDYDCMHNEGDY